MLKVELKNGRARDLKYCHQWFDEKSFKSILAFIKACQYEKCILSINNRKFQMDNTWTKECTIDQYIKNNFEFVYNYLNHGVIL